ncbi:(+)-neomenthol dehydrogenase [Acrasis kona]|uniref:(+)-neomenthol dehydrogenase n=1 Tax=Acrasis kona TaxID=1008807 RepID=A0AAW2Z1L1_9EUKA
MSKIILVTGANQGIGFQFAKQLGELGHTVYLGARDIKKGEEAVAKIGLKNVHPLLLDVTKEESIKESVKKIQQEQKHLDVLINNAGIAKYEGKPEVDVDLLKDIFDTNVFGVVRVTNAFIPLLKSSSSPIVLNVSSTVGSTGFVSDPNTTANSFLSYAASKSALNTYSILLSHLLQDVKVNFVSPGYCGTNLNNFAGTLDPKDTVKLMVERVVFAETTGQFYDYDGSKLDL